MCVAYLKKSFGIRQNDKSMEEALLVLSLSRSAIDLHNSGRILFPSLTMMSRQTDDFPGNHSSLLVFPFSSCHSESQGHFGATGRFAALGMPGAIFPPSSCHPGSRSFRLTYDFV